MANETANEAVTDRPQPTRSDFQIVTEPGTGTDGNSWTVRAIWHGCRRIVFAGSVYECCRWVREQVA